MTDRDAVLVVRGSGPDVRAVAAVGEKHGIPVITDEVVGFYGSESEALNAVIALTALPEMPETALFEQNPHRAKKLKGRNRRKW
jgi:hypothetical protein